MGWADLNKNLSYLNDGLQFGVDLLRPKKTGETLGQKISTAGINLFGNASATQNAAELREVTGSNLGYFAKSAAGDDAQKALANTTQASLWTYQMDSLFGNRCCCSHQSNLFGMNPWDSMMGVQPWNSATINSSGGWTMNIFKGNWFG